MQIAAEHPKGQRVRTRQNMEERLFLGWIAGQRGDVVSRHAQVPALVEANFADAAFPDFDQTAMAAGITPERTCIEMFSEFRRAFRSHRVEDGGERC